MEEEEKIIKKLLKSQIWERNRFLSCGKSLRLDRGIFGNLG